MLDILDSLILFRKLLSTKNKKYLDKKTIITSPVLVTSGEKVRLINWRSLDHMTDKGDLWCFNIRGNRRKYFCIPRSLTAREILFKGIRFLNLTPEEAMRHFLVCFISQSDEGHVSQASLVEAAFSVEINCKSKSKLIRETINHLLLNGSLMKFKIAGKQGTFYSLSSSALLVHGSVELLTRDFFIEKKKLFHTLIRQLSSDIDKECGLLIDPILHHHLLTTKVFEEVSRYYILDDEIIDIYNKAATFLKDCHSITSNPLVAAATILNYSTRVFDNEVTRDKLLEIHSNFKLTQEVIAWMFSIRSRTLRKYFSLLVNSVPDLIGKYYIRKVSSDVETVPLDCIKQFSRLEDECLDKISFYTHTDEWDGSCLYDYDKVCPFTSESCKNNSVLTASTG